MATTKKTPTLGLHRIAKLLGNDSKLGKSAGNFAQTIHYPIAELRMVFIKLYFPELKDGRDDAVRSSGSDVAVSSLHQETETRPAVTAWGRLGSARSDIINLTSQTPPSQTTVESQTTPSSQTKPSTASSQTTPVPGSQTAVESQNRCNGKLQRTKRIEPEPDPGDDKDSIASVTIISVPSGINVTPVTTSDQPREPGLIKQSSLPPPSSQLRNKQLGKRSQSPNSGWL